MPRKKKTEEKIEAAPVEEVVGSDHEDEFEDEVGDFDDEAFDDDEEFDEEGPVILGDFAQVEGTTIAPAPEGYKAGFVAVVGKPNVGKSTLINEMVGQKISIVSPKPQTTRRRVLGIITQPDAQIVFVDTPGIHAPKNQLGKFMVETARKSVPDSDLTLFVVDGSQMPSVQDQQIAAMLKKQGASRLILALNKMDRLKADKVERHTQAYWDLIEYDDWIMTTATRGHNVDKLLKMIIERLPEAPPFFPEDQVTDQSERMFASELIREKVLMKTHQEVPHAVAVVIDRWEERENGVTYIAATIFVEREGQKAILIGERGAMLKQIGQLAREEIEETIERKVFLELWVKVKADWRQNPNLLRSMEYRME